MKNLHHNSTGITLIEAIFALAIFGLITAALTTLFISSIRWNGVVWDQLAAHTDGRKVMEETLHDIRKIEPSSIGSYPIESASSSEFIFFANLDTDTARERVRYTLSGTTLKKGITKPSGNPLRYVTSTEQLTTLAQDVQNISSGVPLFSYYGSEYTGSEAPLSAPVTTTAIHGVRIQIELEHDQNHSPVPFHVESFADIRNL